MAVWHDPSDPVAGAPRLGCDQLEDRGPEANERGLQVALRLAVAMLVLAAFARAALS